MGEENLKIISRRGDASILKLTPEQLREAQERAVRGATFEAARDAVCKWWPSHMPLLKAQLGAASTLLFSGIQHSIALFTMGESGSGKSMEIKAFTGLPHHKRVLRVDKFTIASLLSGYGEKKSEELEQEALFRRAKHRIIVTPELARLFRGKTTGILEERFSELAGWLDGEGIVSVTGTHGFQGTEGDYTCVWLGCTTPFHLQAWRAMERLGQRLLFYPAAHIGQEAEVAEEDLSSAVTDLHAAAHSVLDLLFKQHEPRTVTPWPTRPKPVEDEINRLTDLLADGHIISAGVGSSEPSTRPDAKHFRSRIREIVSGAVWATGRCEADESDIREIVRPIVQRSMPQSRGPVLLALYDGINTVKEIAHETSLSQPTVDRTLNDLHRMEIVRQESPTATTHGSVPNKWFLAERGGGDGR